MSSLEAFAQAETVSVKAEVINGTNTVKVTCTDSDGYAICGYNDFLITLKKMRATIGTVTIAINGNDDGQTLIRRTIGMSNTIGFPLIITRDGEVVS